MKTKSKTSGYIVRSAAIAVLLLLATIFNGDIFAWLRPASATGPRENSPLRILSFADRVAYQRAIEEVYWRHRIWPNQRHHPKPSLDAVMSQSADREEGRRLSARIGNAGELLAKAYHS